MTAARTPSQRGAHSRRKGASAELAVAKWLRTVGFGGAERAVRTGYRTSTRVSADPGDLTGTPGIIWSIKDCAVERIDDWFDELDDMHDAHDWGTAAVGLLVVKRRGKADPGRWWCWMRLRTLVDVAAVTIPVTASPTAPVRMELGHVLPLLHAADYGDPTEEAS